MVPVGKRRFPFQLSYKPPDFIKEEVLLRCSCVFYNFVRESRGWALKLRLVTESRRTYGILSLYFYVGSHL